MLTFPVTQQVSEILESLEIFGEGPMGLLQTVGQTIALFIGT